MSIPKLQNRDIKKNPWLFEFHKKFLLVIYSILFFVLLFVLHVKKFEVLDKPILGYLKFYSLIMALRIFFFLCKNRRFFKINFLPKLNKNPRMVEFNLILEIAAVWWYILGHKLVVDSEECKMTCPMLYNLLHFFVYLEYYRMGCILFEFLKI